MANFIDYSIASGWTAVDGVSGVYYREVAATDTVREFSVLKDNQVTVKKTVTKDMMDGITEQTKPTLSFTAYAVQKAGITTVADAWAKAQA